MRKKLSKKQITAMGLTAIMAVQTSVMAAEVVTSPETTVQEITQEQPEEAAEVQNEKTVESQTEEVENVTQAQPDESVEVKTSESANQEESQLEEIQSTEVIETEPSETEISSEQAAVEYAAENQEVLTDGWHKDNDGNFSYVKDGQIVENKVIEIDGKYYGLDDRGIMHANKVFYIRDSEDDTYLWYRAKEDGSLYVNEWDLKWEPVAFYYYYGEEGKAESGLQEVDGTLYYFETGRRYQNTSVTVDGKNYYCSADGAVIELQNDNWVDIDGKHMYVRDGQVAKKTVIEIVGKYYGFDDSGAMYTNKSFSIWDSESRTASYYRAREDGSIYVKEWYRDSSKYYYYGEEGKAASGLQEVDGTLYCFNDEGIKIQALL